MIASGHDVYRRAFLRGLKPDPILTVCEWADAHRMLSQRSSAEPGKWRTKRTPYLKEIMECLSAQSPIEEVVFMAGAQLGKSETLNNWTGYIIDRSPGPMMMVQPTVELAKRYSKQRVDPLLEETPRLKAKVKPARERDGGNTQLAKEFPGGILVLTGANSAVGLRSLPARFLGMDEIDGYPVDVDGEGDPVTLARARTRTFARRKILLTSTPTIAGRSRIEQAFNESDQRRYYVPCPECGHMQVIKWANLKWDENHIEDVYLECEERKCKIREHNKTKMLEAGEWRADNPNPKSVKIAGFHINSLYSPVGWFSWADAVKLWLDSYKYPDRLRAFVNTVLGEVWKEQGDAPDWRRLYERRESFQIGVVPQSVNILFLTAGVDVQKDRLEIQVIGWTSDKQSYSIDYVVIPGDTADTSDRGPWGDLHDLIMSSQYGMPLILTGIDSGYETQTVYDFVRRFPPNKVIATKGFDHLQVMVGMPNAVDVVVSGRKIRRGLKVWPIGSSLIKTEIYANLRLDRPTDTELAAHGFPPGFIHHPQYGEDFFKQLTAEQIMSRIVKGYRKFEWTKVYERNEALDTMVIARACAAVVGLDRMAAQSRINDASEKQPEIRRETDDKIQKTDESRENFAQNREKAPIVIQRKKSSFWG